MALVDYLDKGASLGPDEPCLVAGERTLTYLDVQELSRRVAGALHHSGVRAGDSVAILSGNDPIAFAAVFGISRLGAVWCPINPRNEAEENRALLDLFDCTCLIFQAGYAALVEQIAPALPKIIVFVCLDAPTPLGTQFSAWLDNVDEVDDSAGLDRRGAEETVMLVGTGGTTGSPKGVVLTDRNLETMSAITLMSYPFEGRPAYLALAPLTHAAGVLCFPIMALGGRIVIMAHPDVGQFLHLIETHRVTHTFLPPTVVYMALADPAARTTNFGSLQCFWYGAAPMSITRLKEAMRTFGPVMAQLFGQSEAPMMISTMSPQEHMRPDGTIAEERLGSAGHPSPLVNVAIMDEAGNLLDQGKRGEIVVRSSLVMAGYYKNPDATAEAGAHGWHHTGDIGYLDQDNYLFIVDRAKDVIITGGYNVYSAEVEQALMSHPDVHEAAVIGLPDDKWGERVTAVVQLLPDHTAEPDAITAFVKARIGSVKTPKQVEIWPELPRSKIGKILKPDIRAILQEKLVQGD
jgi:fatty-acyl-CoA synthase